jgi:lysozyme
MDKFSNIYIGLVVNNKDPKNRGRVQVFVPHITNTLYQNWNNKTEDIRFRTLDSGVFNSEITQRLIDVLPWSNVAMPFFGGGTGAPINQSTNEPTPIPTDPVVSAPGEYMVSSGGFSDIQIPLKNLHENRTVDVNRLNPTVKKKASEFITTFPNAVITSAAEGSPSSGIHSSPNSRHYPENGASALDIRSRLVDDETKAKYVRWFANNGASNIFWEGDHLHVDWSGSQNGSTNIKAIGTSEPSWFSAVKNDINNSNSNSTPTSSSTIATIPKKDGLNNHDGQVSNSVQSNTNNGSLYSNNLLTFIKEREGYSAKAYNDGEDNGVPRYSIGYGTVAKSPTETIDKTEAESRLRNEIDQSANLTNKALAERGITNLTQSQKEALMSFTYNLGPGEVNQLLDSEGGRKDWKTISEAIPLYNKAGGKVLDGLTARRGAEVYYANTNGQGGYVPDNSNKDPQKLNMVTSSFQNVNAGDKTVGMSGGGMGMFSVPHIGSKAYVMFLDGNPMKPIIVGCYQEPSNA